MHFSSDLTFENQLRASRRGAAFLLVLVILVVAAGLVSAFQHHQAGKTIELRMERAKLEVRGGLLLGLSEGMKAWAEDMDTDVSHPAELWAEAISFETEDGVKVRVVFEDLQGRFNLNWLVMPEELFGARGPGDVFRDLLAYHGLRPETQILTELREEGQTLRTPGELVARYPDSAEWLRATEEGDPFELLTTLPSTATGMTTLNLNTAHPAVLRALVGDSLASWVDTVEQMRESEPIRSVHTVLEFLPEVVQNALRPLLDVRTRYVEVRVEAEYDLTLHTLRAVLVRGEQGVVEVIKCQW
ncbi:MAG: general secretion pathway protein GspK [Verrucomicrobia bacterium]|nr:general secretion pathway protein GspK [Verrucomicrobiota bacterium]MCH8512280.1 general secretion pathway protein GspK [Kiritimatiellia bacterium]